MKPNNFKHNILIISNNSKYTFKLRRELLISLQEFSNVYLVCSKGNYDNELERIVYKKIHLSLKGRSVNPFSDFIYFFKLYKIISNLEPDFILTFTTKPNIYGGFIAGLKNIPYISNITGLGDGIKTNKIYEFLIKFLYRLSLKKAKSVFFQNMENLSYFLSNIVYVPHVLLPGSGINANLYSPLDINMNNVLRILYLGRIMKSKGIYVIKNLADNYKLVSKPFKLTIVGKIEDSQNVVNYLKKFPFIEVLSEVDDVANLIGKNDILINPSFHEGMSNVVLEASAIGRPSIVSNISGLKEIIQEGINGYLFEKGNYQELIEKINDYIMLSKEEKKMMSKNSREIIEKSFSREIIVKKYVEEIFSKV
jgi:glycosyltransferase involved in cell wall biosynthesis